MNKIIFKNLTNDMLKEMLFFTDKIEPTFTKNGNIKNIGTYLIPTAFDIETTNDEKTQTAYMYIWQFAIRDNVIFGRTWEEFIQLINKIIDVLELNIIPYKINVLVHNLSYEFQFMRKYLQKSFTISGFFMENREPVTVDVIKDKLCIQFQDSMKLSQCSLRGTAKTYCKTQKLPDFNYDVKRNHLTELSDRELEYCANDVIILTEYYEYLIEHIIKEEGYFPITQTQIPRKQVKKRWLEWRKGKNNPNKNYIKSIYPKTYNIYKNDMNYLFRGGYTHANVENADIEITDNILHIDFTSSYPSVLLHDYFPVSAFKNVVFNEEYLNTKCCILLCKFTNIRAKSPITYDSVSKAIKKSEDYLEDNGRLLKASEYIVKITELDYKIYEKVYNWDKCEIIKCKIADKGKLPNYLTDLVIYYYEMKSKIKRYGDPKHKDKLNYEYSKRMVNSLYGMMCTKENIKEILYDEGYLYKDLESELKENWDTHKNEKFLSPYWGIWCTAQARFRLFDLIGKLIDNKMTELYLYSDTDSHFCLDNKFIRDYIKEYNKNISELNKEYSDLLSDLGEFTLEHSPEKDKIYSFKTLGAKRYLLKTDKGYECTVAGLPKEYIDEKGNAINLFQIKLKDYKNPFDFFTNNMLFDMFESHKKANHYNDECQTTIINGVEETSLSGVYIFNVPFTLKLSKSYIGLINSIKEERIKG